MKSQAASKASDDTVGAAVIAQISVAKLNQGSEASQAKDPSLKLDRSPTATKRARRLRPRTIRFNITLLQ
jgi:hypothetical protein